MKLNVTFDLILLVIGVLASCAYCKTSSNITVERPLRIGSFNIQNFGESKSSNKTIMDIIEKILLRYDLVLVEDIVAKGDTVMDDLLKDLNELTPNGNKYSMTMSDRLGPENGKEQYAFIYRTDKVTLLKNVTYPDPQDDFTRPPFIAHFETPTLRDMDSLLAIGIHIQAQNAVTEINALASAYDFAVTQFKIKDAIIMGDMNAGCGFVRISDWANIDLRTRTEFTWLIKDDVDTTVSGNCCPNDRFVVAGDNMNASVIWDSINVFKFRDEYGLSMEMALAVSDHFPIEVELRGGTSKEIEENITPRLCLVVTDKLKTSLPAEIEKEEKVNGFEINAADSFVNLYSESSVNSEVLQNLQKLSDKYPELVPSEIVDTILYKDAHSALVDKSSHNDLRRALYSMNVHFDRQDESTTVNYCTATTIN